MNENEFKLSEEDKIRMKRLSQEMFGRLTEMSSIVSSTLQSKPYSLSQVVFKLPEKIGDSIEITFGSGQGIEVQAVGVYRDPPGICEPA